MSVCLFVCLFVWIWSPSYWMDSNQIWHGPPPGPVGNLKILFWVNPPEGGKILEKLKNPNFPLIPIRRSSVSQGCCGRVSKERH